MSSLVVAGSLCAWPSDGGAAQSTDAEERADQASRGLVTLTARSTYQGYTLSLFPGARDAGHRNVNRFSQSLDGGIYALAAGQVDVVFSLRYTTDFGTGFHRDTPADAGIPAVDGKNVLGILYFYVDWRSPSGFLNLRLGRQLILDDLAWNEVDGLKASIRFQDAHARNRLEVDAYAGLPVALDRLFSSDAFLWDGTEVYDGRSLFHGLALGGSARATVMRDLSASLTYRQALVHRSDAISTFSDEESAAASDGKFGLQEHLFGLSLGYLARPVDLSLYASLSWDLFVGKLDQGRAGVAFDPGPGFHVQAEYLRSRPRFAGDSIFNFFNIFGYDRGRIEGSMHIMGPLIIEAGYFVQAFEGGALSSGATFKGSNTVHGPSAGIEFRPAILPMAAGARFEASTNFGAGVPYGGTYRFGELFGNATFLGGRLSADARLSFTTTASDWYENVDADGDAPSNTSYRIALGATVRPVDFLDARLLLAQNIDALLEGSHYVLSELSVRY
ncbi:MAG: hypothetical protein IPK13_18940 [Deltaproteobacteria bacterium]|nr:hypothetical protein [Deltaproteobacteria bacterium]